MLSRTLISRGKVFTAGSAALMLSGSMWIGGCNSPNEYNPPAKPTELSAYAASTKYPTGAQAKDDNQLTAMVDSKANTVTIHNYKNGPLTNFNLWLNGSYVLHVDQIEANSYRVFNLSDMYNNGGNNDLKGANVQQVQVQMNDGKLCNVQGPQQM